MEVLCATSEVLNATNEMEAPLPTKILLGEDQFDRDSYSCFTEDDDCVREEPDVTEMDNENIGASTSSSTSEASLLMYEVLRRPKREVVEEGPVLTMSTIRENNRKKLTRSMPDHYSIFSSDDDDDDGGADDNSGRSSVSGTLSISVSASELLQRKRKRTIGGTTRRVGMKEESRSEYESREEPGGTSSSSSGSDGVVGLEANGANETTQVCEMMMGDVGESKRKRMIRWEVEDVQALVQRSLDFNNAESSNNSNDNSNSNNDSNNVNKDSGEQVSTSSSSREECTNLFKQWLEMKQKEELDLELVARARVLQPENLYQHFEEFLPYNPEAYDMKVQYERACAEKALKQAKERSWLLRRSSYNRRFNGTFKVSPKAQGDMANCLRMGNENAALRSVSLSFYAFSYKKPNKSIGHLLCVKFGDCGKWAFASSSGVDIELESFFDTFVDLLAFMLRCTGSLPKRVVLGYLTLEGLNK